MVCKSNERTSGGCCSLFATEPHPLLAVVRLLEGDVPPMEGMVVAELYEGVLQRLRSGARHADADDLHGLGAGSWRRFRQHVNVVLEKPAPPTVKV